MNKRISLALILLLLFAISLPAFVFAQQSQERTTVITRQPGGAPPISGRNVRSRSMSSATANVEQDFAEALTIIQDNYVEGNKLDYNNVFKSSIIGMLRSLDPHSNFYDRQEFDEMKVEQRSEYFGIGSIIGSQTVGDVTDTFITAPFENSPAARAGLRFGDRIIEVDGVKMRDKSSAEVRDKIRGPRGSTVKLTLERASNGRTETVEITRDAVALPTISNAYMLNADVGYINITQFNYTTADELQAALNHLHSKNMKSLVLDLRGNPGGFLDQAIKVAEKFLPSGQVILTQKGRGGLNDRIYRSENLTPDTTPLVLLVNGGSASASEIVAGAMQDHDRALIVGETSFGKGLVQSILPLDYGAGLTLTTGKYLTPSGRLIQRDYSNGGFYDYITRGGSNRLNNKNQQTTTPSGPESRTDAGRVVYSGGGITPDETIKPRTFNNAQAKLLNPLFGFSRELVNGRIAGFENYKVQRAIDFDHRLQPTDFPMTDALYKAFKDYVAGQATWKTVFTEAVLDRNRAFIEQQVRYNALTAAFGKVAADELLINDDPQVAKAIEVLPRARDLAANGLRSRNQP